MYSIKSLSHHTLSHLSVGYDNGSDGQLPEGMTVVVDVVVVGIVVVVVVVEVVVVDVVVVCDLGRHGSYPLL